MQLENTFTVPASPEEAWKTLLDVERVAPCMLGATLTSHDGDTFAGTVKVKVGPIAMTYKGTAAFTEKDEASKTVVIDAKGRESRGSGTANAKITCKLAADGDGTRVDVLTDLTITGKPAQFGRGVIGEVAGKVITQFADALSEEIQSGGPSAPVEAPAETPTEAPVEETVAADSAVPDAAADDTAADADTAEPVAADVLDPAVAELPEPPAPKQTAPKPTPVPAQPRRSAEAIDLLDVAGAPVAKRLLPVGVAAIVALLAGLLIRRRRR